MKPTKVIAAFPACGKTYCFEREDEFTVLDSDSSKFSWSYDPECLASKYRNPDFPNNYIEYIKESIGKVDFIFVSTHEEVRKALAEAGIDFTIVFPEQSLRNEWVGRCFTRGSTIQFCQLIADMWDDWIIQMEEEIIYNNRKYYRLKSNEHLSDILNHI